MRQSLQFRLSAWLSALIVSIALIGGALSFFTALNEVNEFQDDMLIQIAAIIDLRDLPFDPPGPSDYVPRIAPETRVVIEELPKRGLSPEAPRSPHLGLPADFPDGLQTVTEFGEPWRVYVVTLGPDIRIAVGQETEVRDLIARHSAWRTLMPFFILIPMLLLVLRELIRRTFRPTTELAADLDRQGADSLRDEAVTRGLPAEILPFVEAIKQLLARMGQLVTHQRRFISDAAHELRSPLAALSLQAERLALADMSAKAHDQLVSLRKGMYRAQVLLDQLLTLARVQGPIPTPVVPVSLERILRQVFEDMVPRAEAKQIDIGVEGADEITIAAPEIDLVTLVKNLVDNAIRYTPRGGRVDLVIRRMEGSIVLQIDDTGPGIPETERARVLDPFYRVPGTDEVGSGLGLSIVKTIAQRIGASVELSASRSAEPHGLRVLVTFRAP